MNLRWTWLLLLVITATGLPAQDLEKAERYAAELKRVFEQERRSLDSLSHLLEANARLIEAEKKRIFPDRNLLGKRMSDGVWMAKKVKEQQNRVDRLEQDWMVLQKHIHDKYTSRIDSLSALSLATASKEKTKDIEKQIWELTQKRLLFSPAVRMLSFDMALVNSISFSPFDDSLEMAIRLDYLEKAHEEVSSRLAEVRQKRKEYALMIRMQRKLETFVEEIGEQGFLPLGGRSVNPVPPGFVYADERYWNNQMRSVVNLLRQLYVVGSMSAKSLSLHKVEETNVEEYLGLLEETEKQLAEYQRYIKNKMQ